MAALGVEKDNVWSELPDIIFLARSLKHPRVRKDLWWTVLQARNLTDIPALLNLIC